MLLSKCYDRIEFSLIAETFEPHYGVDGREGDGDVFKQQNILAFTDFVLENTEGKGKIALILNCLLSIPNTFLSSFPRRSFHDG